MTSILSDTEIDFGIVVVEDSDPELTCELRNPAKRRCSRPAYVSAQLKKPCGHFNANFLICRQHWDMLVVVSDYPLVCGRCGESFNLKPCIVSWDLV